MLSTCEFRDEFTLPELQSLNASSNPQTNCENDVKSFEIDTPLLSIENTNCQNSIVNQPIFDSTYQSKEDNTDTPFSSPFFDNDISKNSLLHQEQETNVKENNVSLELFDNSKRKLEETTVANKVTHLNKRKRSFVQKSLIDIPPDNDEVFDDDDENIDSFQTCDDDVDLEFTSKKHKQLQNPKLEFDVKINESPGQDFIVKNHEHIKIKRPKALPEKATKIMKEWFEANLHNPYPTEDERKTMAEQGEINENQVKAWFANKRNRSSNTKIKSKSKSSVSEEPKKVFPPVQESVNFDDNIKANKPRILAKKPELIGSNKVKCKLNQPNYSMYPNFQPNLDCFSCPEDEFLNSKAPRFMYQQSSVNNFPGYYPYFPKQDQKFIDVNNNYFNPYQPNTYDFYNPHFCSNMYTPAQQNENFINQNILNQTLQNNIQFYENLSANFPPSCSHYTDPSLIECSLCTGCNQENAQNELMSSNNQTPLHLNRCDTPPPIITKNSFLSTNENFDPKQENKNQVCQKSKLQTDQNQKQFDYNFYNYSFPPGSGNMPFTDFIPIQNGSYIKSPLIGDPLNIEPVSSIIDSLNQNGLCLPTGQNFYPQTGDYGGSTVTINNINYTNANGSYNSISSILTKPGSFDPSNPDPSIINGNDNFNSVFNLALNNIMSKNSAFQKYGKCVKQSKVSSNGDQDSRFTDSKAKEWCLKSHPKLANTLLNHSVNNYMLQQNAGYENKKNQNFSNFG